MSVPCDTSYSKQKENDLTINDELLYYKKKTELLENDLYKLQSKNKQLEDGLRKLQELNTIYAKVIFR